MSTNVHDPEETREQQATRLLAKDINRLAEQHARLRERARRYGRVLSPPDRTAAIEEIESQAKMTVESFHQQDDRPPFGFPSDVLNEEWS